MKPKGPRTNRGQVTLALIVMRRMLSLFRLVLSGSTFVSDFGIWGGARRLHPASSFETVAKISAFGVLTPKRPLDRLPCSSMGLWTDFLRRQSGLSTASWYRTAHAAQSRSLHLTAVKADVSAMQHRQSRSSFRVKPRDHPRKHRRVRSNCRDIR